MDFFQWYLQYNIFSSNVVAIFKNMFCLLVWTVDFLGKIMTLEGLESTAAQIMLSFNICQFGVWRAVEKRSHSHRDV